MAQADVMRSFVAPGEAVSYTASSARSGEMPGNTNGVRLVSTTDCFYEIGGSTVTAAANTSTFLPAGVVEYVSILPGQYVAAIRLSVDGTLYLRETN